MDTIFLLPVSLALAAFTLAYTPSTSKLRPLAGFVILGFNWKASQSSVARWFPGLIGPEYILGWILACNSWINMAQLQYDQTTQGQKPRRTRLGWAIYQIFDTRWGVSASQTPAFDKKRPRWVPSREYFLVWKMWTISWTGALLFILALSDPLQMQDLYNLRAGLLYRLGDVTRREMALRIYYGFAVLIQSYCCLCLMHAVCGLIAVGVFKDDPAGWKPLHGSPREVWSIRNFYHKFWHQVMRKGFTTHAGFLVNDILRLPRKHFVSRYLIAFFTFLISGLYHAALTPEIPWRCSMLQINYQLNILGVIILEDIVAMGWKKLTRLAGMSKSKRTDRQVDVSDKKESAMASGSHLPPAVVRHRFVQTKIEDVDVPASQDSTSKSLKDGHSQSEPPSPRLRVIGYIWTACIMILLNSTLTFQTNICMVNHHYVSTMNTYLNQEG